MEQQKDNKTQHFVKGHHGGYAPHRSDVGNRSLPPFHVKTNGDGDKTIGNASSTNHLMNQQKTNLIGNSGQQSPPTVRGFAYVMRKAEKLTTALYLVTDIMSEKDPMKWKVRESGVDLLSDITMASTLQVSEKMSVLREAMKKTEKIIAFLDVAESAHLISEMNSSMLKREYVALKDSIEMEWTSVYEKSKSVFSDTFFDVPQPPASHPTNEQKISQGHSYALSQAPSRKAIEHFADKVHNMHVPSTKQHTTTEEESLNRPALSTGVEKKVPTGEIVAEKITPVGQEVVRPQSDVSFTPVASTANSQQTFSGTNNNDGQKNDRRSVVLSLIKQKPALTVKDIAKNIPQVSEKTIQRELLAMVAENVLVKRGERRWSTYSLRQQ